MRLFLITDIGTMTTRPTSQLAAAEIAALNPDELEYLLEEEGVCETDRYTIVDIVPKMDSNARFYSPEWLMMSSGNLCTDR